MCDEDEYIRADFNMKCAHKYLRERLESTKNNLSLEEYQSIWNNIHRQKFVGDGDSESLYLVREISLNNVEVFWDSIVDFTASVFQLNKNPLIVQCHTPLIKIQYLFLMLGLMQIYVTKNFKICGVIYRHYFTTPGK